MSALISRLMSRIRQRQIETIKNSTDEYRELLAQAVTDESSVDLDDAERIRELMGKSLEDFAADIVTTRKRLEAAETLKGESKIRSDFAAAQARHSQLNAEVAAYRAEMSTKIQSAWSEVQRLELEVMALDTAHQTLRQSIVDQSLTERTKDNTKRQRELRERKEAVLEAIRQTNTQIANCQKQIDYYQNVVDDSRNSDKPIFAEKLQGYESGMTRLEAQLQHQRGQLQDIETELRQAQAEAAEIDRLKLIP